MLILLGFYALLGIRVAIGQERWVASDFPNPQLIADSVECGLPNERGWVCDTIEVLTVEQLRHLNMLIEEGTNSTDCMCAREECRRDSFRGPRIAIALLDTIDAGSSTMEGEKYDNAVVFAEQLNRLWSFGRCDDDITIVYEAHNNIPITYVDQTLQYVLTPRLVSEISFAAKPDIGLRGNMFNGLSTLINNYYKVLRGEYQSQYKAMSVNEPVIGAQRGSPAQRGQPSVILLLSILLVGYVYT